MTRVAWLALLLPLAFVAVSVVPLVGREVTAPSWITERVEAEVTSILAGGDVSFGEIKMTLGRDLHPRVTLNSVIVRDAAGVTLARLPRAEVLVSPRGLILRRNLLVQEVSLTGLQINLRRTADGTVALAFDSTGADVRTAAGFAELLDEVDRALEQPALEALEQIVSDGMIVNFADARAGRSWTVDGGFVTLDLRGQKTTLRGDMALLSGRSYVTSIALSYESPRGSSEASIGFNLTDAVAADLATQSPALSWLALLDAPLSAAMRASIAEDGQLGPLNATLEIGEGAIQPNEATRPIPFSSAKAYLTYDPQNAEITFDRISAESSWGTLEGEGQAFLRGVENGWPNALIGQVNISDLSVNPRGMFETPRTFEQVSTDFRLRIDPFELDIGQYVVAAHGQKILGNGRIGATDVGWDVALNATADQVGVPWLLSHWPEGLRDQSRSWFLQNLSAGSLRDFSGSLRIDPEMNVISAGNFEFANASLTFLDTMAPIEEAFGFATWNDRRMTLSFDEASMTAAQGGKLNLAGSAFHREDMTLKGGIADITVEIDSTITALNSILDQEPLNFLTKANLPVTIADGRALVSGLLRIPMRENVPPEEIDYRFDAQLLDVRSDTLVRGHPVAASRLALHSDRDIFEISGPMRLGEVAGDGRWFRNIGAEPDPFSTFNAQAVISEAFLREFDIAIPAGDLTGRGSADVEIVLRPGQDADFSMTSDLQGVGLALPSVGWAKPAGQTGLLEMTGTLGAIPKLDRIRLSANGLDATGSVTISDSGGLDVAEFTEARVGGWFDGSLRLRGRGRGEPLGIELPSGVMDLRRAQFGIGSSGDGSSGDGGPITIALDRLDITEGVALHNVRGEFGGSAGLSGQFTGLLNNDAAIQGTIVPVGVRSAVRIRSSDAGSVFRAAGLLQSGGGGDLVLTLTPAGQEGHYDGVLAATDLRVKDAPALAGLLDAISVVGLLQQMDGQGLAFSNVDAQFRLTPEQIIVTQSSAVGPGLGLSMDGIYTLENRERDFQGVISPLYLLNGLGAILTRRGEGLIGFNYRLTGLNGESQISVNPLSALTPGMFREIFRKPPPTVSE